MADNVSDELEALAGQIRACRLCPLHACRTNAVPGAGNAEARILLVGEGPGRNEDEQGQPFVGMAGKFLDKLLADAGLERSQVFITNVVKCRPPENRAPEKSEMEACSPYLQAQIAAIDPELIVLLGGTAAKALLGLKQISKDVGQLIERNGRYYFITHHPAARFHRRQIRDDFDKLRLVLQRLPHLAQPRSSLSRSRST